MDKHYTSFILPGMTASDSPQRPTARSDLLLGLLWGYPPEVNTHNFP